jgi:hypothetical protein
MLAGLMLGVPGCSPRPGILRRRGHHLPRHRAENLTGRRPVHDGGSPVEAGRP